MIKYVVIYTDFGDTCDGLARVEGIYDSRPEAYDAMRADVEVYLQSNHNNPDIKVTEENDNYILVGDDESGCQWQILELEV
jgi:hypothetical protein